MHSLLARVRRRRPVHELLVPVPGAAAPYRLVVPANASQVLDELAENPPEELRTPYWATLWPSGIALAWVVLARRDEVCGRRVLELGCGLGATAIATLEAGATLVAADCFAETLAYCGVNGVQNTGRPFRRLMADWRTVTGQARLLRAAPFDVILAADVLYEPEDIAPLRILVPQLLAPGGVFWLAEPGRTNSTRFLTEAATLGWQSTCWTAIQDWPGAGHATVSVHFFQAGTMRPPAPAGSRQTS